MKTTATGATVNLNQGLQDKRYTVFKFRTNMIIENIVYKAHAIPRAQKFPLVKNSHRPNNFGDRSNNVGDVSWSTS